MDPDEARAWYGLALVFVEDDQPDRARESLQSALGARPGYADALFVLGTLQRRAGNVSGAVASWQAAIEADPRHVAALNNVGRVLVVAKATSMTMATSKT